MRDISSGVSWYTVGRAQLEINFPEDHVCCKYCRYRETDRPGHRCILTNEIIYDLNYLDRQCPIKDLEEKNHEHL